MKKEISTVQKIKTLHQQVIGAFKNSLKYAREAGRELAKLKAEGMNRKAFEALAKECGFSPPTADNYVRIHNNWHEVESEDNYTSALRALRKTRTPKSAPAPEQPTTTWQKAIADRMHQHIVRGNVENVERFLESFGVYDPAKMQSTERKAG